MFALEVYAAGRRFVFIEGNSRREAARVFGLSRETVLKMCRFSLPPGYTRTKPVAKPKLGPLLPVIDAILDADRTAPVKQRHSAKRIFERLCDEHGFAGGYTVVKDYVRLCRARGREMFVPLAHPPWHAQVDFGEAVGDVLVGDGSYMMANSELATSVMLGQKIIVVILDNRGYGCIQRLQTATGSPAFNNLLDDCVPEGGERSSIDFAMHARSMGADAVHVKDVAELKAAMVKARQAKRTQVIVIDTTHTRTTDGGCWWEVAIPEVSSRAEVREAHATYVQGQTQQRV